MPTRVKSKSKKKSKQQEIPLYERDPRWPRFVQLLLQYQNANKAARDAGYSISYAKTGSHKMAAHVLDGIKAALWRKGMAVDRMADKLVTLFDAKMPKWNSFSNQWDTFEDAGTQLRAYDRIKTILEPEPPKKLEIDVLVGVKRDETRFNETPEDWEARNQSRRTGAKEGSQALIPSEMATRLRRTETRGAGEEKVVSNHGRGNGHNGSK